MNPKNRQEALAIIWRRLFFVLIALGFAGTCIAVIGKDLRVPLLVFVFGNLGGYLNAHGRLERLNDSEVIEVAGTWWGIVVPPLIGGFLAFVVYVAFLGHLVGGDMFPRFVPADPKAKITGFESLATQHAVNIPAYGKLFFWSFVSGFRQEWAVDIIESVRNKKDGK